MIATAHLAEMVWLLLRCGHGGGFDEPDFQGVVGVVEGVDDFGEGEAEGLVLFGEVFERWMRLR